MSGANMHSIVMNGCCATLTMIPGCDIAKAAPAMVTRMLAKTRV